MGKNYIERDLKYAIGHFNLACVYDDMGEYTLSKYHLDKAKEYGFDESEYKNTLSSILIHENKLDEAEQILNSIPDVPESFFNLGIISLKRNDEVKAKEFFNEYENRAEDSKEMYIEYAQNFDNYNNTGE